jgi:hypothetical protein
VPSRPDAINDIEANVSGDNVMSGATRLRISTRAGGNWSAAGERAALCGRARRCLGRASRLLAGISDLSRLHAGALETYLRPVALTESLRPPWTNWARAAATSLCA